jgi:hypothetical protein
MIERIRLTPRERRFAPRVLTNDALGPQSINMRDQTDHALLLEAGKVWQRHQNEQKRYWSDWTEILGPAFLKVQTEAMAVVSTNKPEGKRYAQVVSGLLKTYHLNEIDSATRSHAIDIMRNLDAVADWRAKQKEPERLNHPTTVWRSFALSEKWRAIRAGDDIKPKARHSSPKPTKSQFEALQAELDTTRTECERFKDECKTLKREFEAKNIAAPATASKAYDDLSIPGFLRRIDLRDALAILLDGEKLTLEDVPSGTTPAALAKLANELNDLAVAPKEHGKFEKVETFA